MNLDRIGNITSQLSASLVKSLVFPEGLFDWLSRPLSDKLRGAQRPERQPQRSSDVRRTSRIAPSSGTVILAGGSLIPDEAIIEVIHLAGGRGANIAVVPVAATDPEQSGAEVLQRFGRFGAKKAHLFELTTREQAQEMERVVRLMAVDAVVLCGESAERGIAVLRETLAAGALADMLRSGKGIAGFDGAAAMLSGRCLIPDEMGGSALVDGLGFVPDLILDVGAAQSASLGRLVGLLELQRDTPALAVGLGAETALVVRGDEARVLGGGSVTFVDPGECTHAHEGAGCTPGSVCGLKAHLLMSGYGIHLKSRKPFTVAREAPAMAASR